MSPSVLILDLQSQKGAPASLVFHDTEICLQVNASEIHGYYHVPLSLEQTDQSKAFCRDKNPKYTKALVKGLKTAVRALELIGYKEGGPKAATGSLSGSVLVGGPPCEGHALLVEGITSFQMTQFKFLDEWGNPSPWTSSHYLHFSSPKANIAPGLLLAENGKSNFESVTIISGMCLFSARLLESSTLCQRVHVENLRYNRPTLYEAEYIARAAPIIADFAALIDTNARLSRENNPFASVFSLDLFLDVPSFHYYQSLDGLLRDNSCTFPVALEWLDEIRKRHEKISRVFRNYIIRQLTRRGCASLETRIQISPSSDLVFSAIRTFLENEELPSLDSVLDTMNSTIPTWDRFYNLVPVKERPRDFRALGYLFYVFQVVRPALLGGPPLTAPSTPCEMEAQNGQNDFNLAFSKPGKLLISIDDAAERRIYSRAQKLLKTSRSSIGYQTEASLLEVYMCRRVFINGNETGSNMYLDDPSPEVLMPGKKVCKFSCEYEERHASKASDIVSTLYGLDAAETLAELFADVGLNL